MLSLNTKKNTLVDPVTLMQQELQQLKVELQQSSEDLTAARARHDQAIARQRQLENSISETLKAQEIQRKEAEIQEQIGELRELADKFNQTVRQLKEDYNHLVEAAKHLESQQGQLRPDIKLQFGDRYGVTNLPIALHHAGSPKFAIVPQTELLNPQNSPGLMGEYGARGAELIEKLLGEGK